MVAGSRVVNGFLLALGTLGAVAAPARLARAQSHQTCALSWVELPGAEGCGGAHAIAKAVEERLGRSAIVSPAQADLSIEARADRSGRPPVWHAVVVLRSADGDVLGIRELNSTADDCGELRSAVALAAALMIDPEATLHGKQAASPGSLTPPATIPEAPLPQAVPALAPPPQIIVQRVEVPVPVPTSTPAARWRVEPSAAFALGFGVLPSVTEGVRAGIIVTPPRMWALEAHAVAWGNQTAFAEQGAQVRFSVIEAGLAACPIRFGSERHPRFDVCGGAEVAFFESESEGFEAPKTSVDPSVRAVIPSRLSFPILYDVALRLGGEVGLALKRDQFVYDDASGASHVLSASPFVIAECDVGLSVSLP